VLDTPEAVDGRLVYRRQEHAELELVRFIARISPVLRRAGDELDFGL
jgi:hypothetical protein